MSLNFYRLAQPSFENPVEIPVVYNFHSFDEVHSSLTFTGIFHTDNSELPQNYIITQEKKQYPFLIKVIKKEVLQGIEIQKLRLYYEVIKEIQTEEEFIYYTTKHRC